MTSRNVYALFNPTNAPAGRRGLKDFSAAEVTFVGAGAMSTVETAAKTNLL